MIATYQRWREPLVSQIAPADAFEPSIAILIQLYHNLFMTDSLTDLTIRMSSLRLNHGQVAEVMDGTQLASGMLPSARDAMIRKLRRSHVPFAKGEIIKDNPRDEVIYHFVHLAELGLSLKLLNDGMKFSQVVALVSQHRVILRGFYREALLEANSGRGEPVPLTMLDPVGTDPKTGEPLYEHAAGLYLDFCAFHRNGVLLMSEPKLLGPKAALSRFMSMEDGLYPVPLVALSQLCTRIEKIASATVPVKRGRKPRT